MARKMTKTVQKVFIIVGIMQNQKLVSIILKFQEEIDIEYWTTVDNILSDFFTRIVMRSMKKSITYNYIAKIIFDIITSSYTGE